LRLSLALQDRDPVVASRAASAFFELSETSQEPDFVQTFTRHRVARVTFLYPFLGDTPAK
jgi:hypothetical protein